MSKVKENAEMLLMGAKEIGKMKEVTSRCKFFINDCENMLDKTLGSYTTSFSSPKELEKHLLQSEWRLKSAEMINGESEVNYTFTVKVNCYDGILSTKRLRSKDVIFAVPGNRLVDYEPVVVNGTGIASKYMSILIKAKNDSYTYMGLYAGKKRKTLMLSLPYGSEVDYKLLNAKWLERFKCVNIRRIDPSVSASYIVKIALKQALETDSKILENLLTNHCSSIINKREFINTLLSLNWNPNNEGNKFIFTAVGISGYRKYLNLDNLDNSVNLELDKSGKIPTLLVKDIQMLSHTVSLKLYVDNSKIHIVDAYFGDVIKDQIDTANSFDLDAIDVQTALSLGFRKARIVGYSPFEDLDLKDYLNYICNSNKYRKLISYRNAEISESFLGKFTESDAMYFIRVEIKKGVNDFKYLFASEKNKLDCPLLIGKLFNFPLDKFKVVTELEDITEGEFLFICVESEKVLPLKGISKEYMLYRPRLIKVLKANRN